MHVRNHQVYRAKTSRQALADYDARNGLGVYNADNGFGDLGKSWFSRVVGAVLQPIGAVVQTVSHPIQSLTHPGQVLQTAIGGGTAALLNIVHPQSAPAAPADDYAPSPVATTATPPVAQQQQQQPVYYAPGTMPANYANSAAMPASAYLDGGMKSDVTSAPMSDNTKYLLYGGGALAAVTLIAILASRRR